MSDVATFFHMGGYAMYVWPSFLITFIVIFANVLFSRAQLKRVVHTTAVRAKARAESKAASD